MLIRGFDWDEVNVEKLKLHDLQPDDVEWLFEYGDSEILRHPDKQNRWIGLGFAPDERFILVPFEYDKKTRWVRVVTAYEPTSDRWWKTYAKSKNLKG